MRVLSVVGARPNFMKLAPVARSLTEVSGFHHIIVHTGQHYDRNMSDTFFDDLGIPDPDVNLDVGSGSHAQQTADIMKRIEPVLLETRPDTVLVYGDVNSTVAAALVASKIGIRVGHVEAGLRSRDWTMPEEINRVVTDRLSDILFAPSPDGVKNLVAEGVPESRIHFVGNVMIDSLVYALPAADKVDINEKFGVKKGEYCLVTLHRPSNVDDPETLGGILEALNRISADLPLVFPVHPRTRQRIDALGWTPGSDVRTFDPIPYREMLALTKSARVVVTDSGGVQEETSYLGVPCLTLRPNTERPITCEEGTNRLVSGGGLQLQTVVAEATKGIRPAVVGIRKWDGRTADRIAGVLLDHREEWCS